MVTSALVLSPDVPYIVNFNSDWEMYCKAQLKDRPGTSSLLVVLHEAKLKPSACSHRI